MRGHLPMIQHSGQKSDWTRYYPAVQSTKSPDNFTFTRVVRQIDEDLRANCITMLTTHLINAGMD